MFVLTFETEFFAATDLSRSRARPSPARCSRRCRQHDTGVAEFLDLSYVKPNTLGNTRMLAHLHDNG